MKKVPVFALVTVLVSSLLLAGCGSAAKTAASSSPSSSGSSAPASAPAGDVKEPDTITIAWLPNNSGDDEKAMRAEMESVIAKATGKKVQSKLTTDYAIALSALDSGNAQIGLFGANEYIEGHAKNPNIIPLAVESGDSGTTSDALYHSRFLVKKGNEDQYKSGDSYDIDNIVGKKMSFVSTSSTSGFNMPAAAILAKFTSQDKWKDLKKEDLAQSGKFFGPVLMAGSHQLSLYNVLTGKSDISAVDDVDVAQYVDLASGQANTEGAVYTIKQGAAAPFDKLAGAQFVIIKSIPVMNAPYEVNKAFLSQKTIDAITNALTSDEVAKDPKIFAPSGTPGFMFVQPHRFVKVDDSWYDPMRKVLGYSK